MVGILTHRLIPLNPGIHACRWRGDIGAEGKRKKRLSGLRECQMMGVLMDHLPVSPSSWNPSLPSVSLKDISHSGRGQGSSLADPPPPSILPVTAAHSGHPHSPSSSQAGWAPAVRVDAAPCTHPLNCLLLDQLPTSSSAHGSNLQSSGPPLETRGVQERGLCRSRGLGVSLDSTMYWLCDRGQVM